MPERGSDSHRASLVTFFLVLAFFLVLVIWMMTPYFMALFVGCMLALLSFPLFRFLRRRKFGPKLAALIVTIAVLLVVIGPVSAFAALAVSEAIQLKEKLALKTFSFHGVVHEFSKMEPVRTMVGDERKLQEQVQTGVQNAMKFTAASVLQMVKNIPEFLLQVTLVCLACFFCFLDGKRFLNWIIRRSTLDREVRVTLIGSLDAMIVSTVWASVAAAAIQAIMIALGYLLLGVPGAFFAGGLTFIFAFIPVLGSMPATLAATIYLFIKGSILKLILMIGIALLTGVVDNLVRPLVLKGRQNLHPFVALLAIVAGIRMFGLVGVFVGPILIGILISLLEVWPTIGQRFGLRFDG